MKIIVGTHKLRNTVRIDILFKFKFPNTNEKERIKRIKYVNVILHMYKYLIICCIHSHKNIE